MGQITIASSYPMTVGISRPRFQPTPEMWIKGFPEGTSPDLIKARIKHPELYIVTDQMEHNKAPISHIEVVNTFSADEVARDFILHATTGSPGMTADAHPAVWICAGELPTEEEKAFYGARQSRYFANRMDEGNRLATDVSTRRAITWLMRVSAIGLGREPEWLHPPSDLDVQECPYCRKNVQRSAAVCSFCSNVVNPDLFAQLEKRKRDAIKEAQKTVAA